MSKVKFGAKVGPKKLGDQDELEAWERQAEALSRKKGKGCSILALLGATLLGLAVVGGGHAVAQEPTPTVVPLPMAYPPYYLPLVVRPGAFLRPPTPTPEVRPPTPTPSVPEEV